MTDADSDLRPYQRCDVDDAYERGRLDAQRVTESNAARLSKGGFVDDPGMERGPHGWAQWKGTELCMDLHCPCGESSHVDGHFAYHVRCPGCEAVWALNPYIGLVPVPPGLEMTNVLDAD